jgi:type IV secretory pathway VirB10-like protein
MAFNFPGVKFFSTADAKTRVFILLLAITGISFILYVGVRYLSGNSAGTGPSRVANAPSGLQSVPGSQLSSEYYRALMQANTQAAQQAQITGGSAVPTLVNVPGQQTSSQSCTILCPGEEGANVANDINDLVKSGVLSQTDANNLLDLAKKNVSPDEYAAALAELVRQGKLTPEQARKLLEAYKKQHEKGLITSSATLMDGLIKSGKLPLDVANSLLALQKQKVTPAEYAAELARLVKEGKISPETAAQLLAAYTQQQAKEAAKLNAFKLQQMAKKGEITADVAKQLADLQAKNIPADQYAAELQKLVAQGKLTPAAAAKLLADYKAQKIIPGGMLKQLAAKGGASAALAQRLMDLQANNATLSQYADELKRAVQAGLLTPEQAAELMQQYQAAMAAPLASGTTPGVDANIPGAEEFAKLQQRIQQPTDATVSAPTEQFAAAQAQAAADMEQARQQRIQQLVSAMSSQAQSLVTAWQQVPVIQHQAGIPEEKSKIPSAQVASKTGAGRTDSASQAAAVPSGPPLIKAGSILFAVLDTGVDSDYPDTPVMATIVEGKFKGAKLLGKLSANQGPGQDRIALNFTLMDEENWPKTKNVTAFAIDPDTARTVLASSVDYHYMTRYGALFASSFLSGYASAIQSAGSTSTTGIFGSSTSHPELNAGSKIAVGLGQVGTAWSNAVQSYINTPPTIKVNSGVGLGILFMADVTE